MKSPISFKSLASKGSDAISKTPGEANLPDGNLLERERLVAMLAKPRIFPHPDENRYRVARKSLDFYHSLMVNSNS